MKLHSVKEILMKKYEELDITDPFIFAKVMSDKKIMQTIVGKHIDK